MSRGLTVRTSGPEATRACGAALAPALRAGDVLLLSGDLGAGKTQLTEGIAEGLGIARPVSSPTFNLLLVYEGPVPLYHFDLYRLEEPSQLLDIDYFSTLEADGVSVVEWGDRFAESVPSDGVLVVLHIVGDTERLIEAAPLGPRGKELVGAWSAALRHVPGVVLERRP